MGLIFLKRAKIGQSGEFRVIIFLMDEGISRRKFFAAETRRRREIIIANHKINTIMVQDNFLEGYFIFLPLRRQSAKFFLSIFLPHLFVSAPPRFIII
jgi:hypothetical protein